MTRRPRHPAERATDREVGVVAAVLVAGSEKAAAHRLGLTAQLVWILAERLPEPGRDGGAGECRVPGVPQRAQLPSDFGSRGLVASARTRRLGPQALLVSCRDRDAAP